MLKIKTIKKERPKLVFYIYLINFLLIFSAITLKFLDIYYTLILIEDIRVTETIPISQFILSFDPIIVYLVSILPFALFFIINFHVKKNLFYLTILSILMVGIIFYLVPIVQNSLNIITQM